MSPIVSGLENLTVENLINNDPQEWNKQLIENIFYEEDAANIPKSCLEPYK